VSDIVTEPTPDSHDPKPETTDAPIATDAASSGNAALDENSAANTVVDEGLPEWEPLTPELVEDEAIRGDFVIRWVVVGLALLLGISQISETRTLVHLKSGLHLISNGFLPDGKEVFSYTATDRKWINLSWLFDVATAGVYSVGSGIGLSLFQGLLAGLTFALVSHAVRPNIRTWWGSICAALALLACYQQFTVLPELVTLLGLALTLWTLVRSDIPGQAQRLWLLVPAIWIWAQCDPHAWMGWFLLLLWAVGEWLSGKESAVREKNLLLKVALASFAIVAVHPFLWEAWLAPVRTYMTEYPALRFAFQGSSAVDAGIYPIWKPFLWTTLTHRTVAPLVLFVATIICLWLNRTRVTWSQIYAFIGFNSLSLFATHELAAASLVNCVLSTINAQSWYYERNGQVYSIDWRVLLFSRGGRAITVLSFFALAWLILSGRVDGPGGKRTGVGFDSQLASGMSEYLKLNSNLLDNQPFNFSMRQGDFLIWAGLRPFVDSRAGLFFGNGEQNLLDVHNKTRRALRRRRENADGTGEAAIWKETFDKYQIRQAWPRLNGPSPPPDYPTFVDLLSSNDFALDNLNAVTAVFVRKNPSDELTTSYLESHSYDFVKQAFRTNNPNPTDLTREWSKPATTYDNLFALRRPLMPTGVQAAQHYMELASTRGFLSNTQVAACALLAIRHANEGLREEPNSAAGYQILGRSYLILGQLESFIINYGGKSNIPNRLRYLQAVAALRQAIDLQPDDLGSTIKLLELYQSMGRLDVQLELYQKLKRLIPYSPSMSDEQLQEREEFFSKSSRVEESVAEVDKQVNEALNAGTDRAQVAIGAYQFGALLTAIRTMEEDAIYLEKNPQAKLLLGSWLNEAGRCRDAAVIFESLEGLATDGAFPGWRDSAALSAITAANYQKTISLWSEEFRESTSSRMSQAMYTLPFLTLNPLWTPDSYPLAHFGATIQVVQGVRLEGSNLEYHIALAEMEAGQVDDATRSIRQSLQLQPDSPLRPMLRFYLECLTSELIDEAAPAAEIEELTDLNDSDAGDTELK
jgi:tetratricopeptide (TPR) repeat protein